MSETKDTADKTLRAGQRKPLSLNRTVESGLVQQKFSHGRSKSVVVEVKRKRTLGGGEVEEAAHAATAASPTPKVAQQRQAPSRTPQPAPAAGPTRNSRSGRCSRGLPRTCASARASSSARAP